VRDAFAAWKQGIPAVVLVHEPFATLAKAQCNSLGAKDPTTLVYKQDAPARESEEESMEKARGVAVEIVRLLSAKG
jgi:hypothetical protein